MSDATGNAHRWLARWAAEPCACLTTTGRQSGQPHRIEIWFGVDGERIFLLAGGRERADWVRNLMANPRVTVELGDEVRSGIARLIPPGTDADRRARALLVEKYRQGDNLNEWGRSALPVAIEFPPDPG